MITLEEISPIGYTTKPHGIKGDLSITIEKAIFDEDETPNFILEMDGIFVPFFIENFRYKTDTTAIYKFENIDTEEQARELGGKTVYIKNEFKIEDKQEEDGIQYFVGFEIVDKNAGSLGTIKQVDESTKNTLFIIDNHGDELLIPATDYYITDIDELNHIIYMDLPEGLVDLDLAEDE